VTCDVRVVAASNRDLPALVAEGGFREDLFYRLNVVPIELPPLRERLEDVPLLASLFLEQARARHGIVAGALPPSVLRHLMGHHWPGNVRELANVVERLVLLADAGEVQVEDLPADVREAARPGDCPFELPAEGVDWDRVEAGLLAQALARTNGNRAAAARLLGLGYKAMLYRLEKHGMAAVPDGEEQSPEKGR
jgi:two-component system NtrC family response regulator